ncbi:uncharacterized protein LOC127861254 [Dreissena polymorpha]|uniref:C2H2-type domain-containing protein n=1 Tax=Dreissena polymorpha TaxID=45954 RepID=A0A9D4BLF6_DREPO|nr:uncharacterized protein LOC127861254 [Dreissena polymorpha]KAH3699333.1 hypothetical protein DPMN_074289 [Dreissena polymorpha]
MEDKDKLGGYLIQSEDGELLIVCINEDHEEGSVKQELPEPSMSTSENEEENLVSKVIPDITMIGNLVKPQTDACLAYENSYCTKMDPATVAYHYVPGTSQQSSSVLPETAACEASTSEENIKNKMDDYSNSLVDDDDDDDFDEDDDEGAVGGDTPLAMVIQYLNQHCSGYPELDDEVLSHMTQGDADECIKDIDFQLELIEKACEKFEKIVTRESDIMTDINKRSEITSNQMEKNKTQRIIHPDQGDKNEIGSEQLFENILTINNKCSKKHNTKDSSSKPKQRSAKLRRGLPYCCKCGRDSLVHVDKVFIQCFPEAKSDIMDTRLLSEVYGHFETDKHDPIELLLYILQKYCNESQMVCCCFCGEKLYSIHSIFNHVTTTDSHRHFSSYNHSSCTMLVPEKKHFVCVICCTMKASTIEIISHYRYEHQIEHREQISMFCKASQMYTQKQETIVCNYCETNHEHFNVMMQHIRKQHLIIEPMEYKKRKNPLAPNGAVPVAVSSKETDGNIKKRKTSFICTYCKLRFVFAKDLKDHIEKAHSSS